MGALTNHSAFDHPLFNSKEMLRRRAIAAFEHYCSYCQERGDERNGPDGRPWHLDRIVPGAAGGEYEADNVTLSCCACNCGKRDKELDPDDMYPSCLEHEEWLREQERILERRRFSEFCRKDKMRARFGKVDNDNHPVSP